MSAETNLFVFHKLCNNPMLLIVERKSKKISSMLPDLQWYANLWKSYLDITQLKEEALRIITKNGKYQRTQLGNYFETVWVGECGGLCAEIVRNLCKIWYARKFWGTTTDGFSWEFTRNYTSIVPKKMTEENVCSKIKLHVSVLVLKQLKQEERCCRSPHQWLCW